MQNLGGGVRSYVSDKMLRQPSILLNCKKFREVFRYKGKIDDIISGEIKALVAAASFAKEVEDYKEQFEQWI